MAVERGRLREKDYAKIQRNYTFLQDQLDGGFLADFLFEKHVFNIHDKEEISCQPTKKKKTTIFLDKLLDSGPGKAYSVFLETLEYYYPLVAKKLENTKDLDKSTQTEQKAVEDLKQCQPLKEDKGKNDKSNDEDECQMGAGTSGTQLGKRKGEPEVSNEFTQMKKAAVEVIDQCHPLIKDKGRNDKSNDEDECQMGAGTSGTQLGKRRGEPEVYDEFTERKKAAFEDVDQEKGRNDKSNDEDECQLGAGTSGTQLDLDKSTQTEPRAVDDLEQCQSSIEVRNQFTQTKLTAVENLELFQLLIEVRNQFTQTELTAVENLELFQLLTEVCNQFIQTKLTAVENLELCQLLIEDVQNVQERPTEDRNQMPTYANRMSPWDILRSLLPDLPLPRFYSQLPVRPVHIDFDYDQQRDGCFTSQGKYMNLPEFESVMVRAQVVVRHGEFLRFQIVLETGEDDDMPLDTPVRFRLEVSLRKGQMVFLAGTKSCFVPIPFGLKASVSSFIHIDWDDIPPVLRQGMCTSSWEISVEWYTPDHICNQQDRANIALHHLADVLEDRYVQNVQERPTKDRYQMPKYAGRMSPWDILRSLLPDLPYTTYSQRPVPPVYIDFDYDQQRDGCFTSQRIHMNLPEFESVMVRAQVEVKRGEFLRFQLVLETGEDEIGTDTPVRLRWKVLLRKDQMELWTGTKNCFVPIPDPYLMASVSSFTHIDWDDIPSQLQQGLCTSLWEISMEWYTPEHICNQQDRANIALHHLADVLEDKYVQNVQERPTEDINRMPTYANRMSSWDILRSLLPDLPFPRFYSQLPVPPVRIDFDYDQQGDGCFTSQGIHMNLPEFESVMVHAQVVVRHGEFLRFQIVLETGEYKMRLDTPVRLRLEVSLRKDLMVFLAGTKSCFVPIPFGLKASESSFIHIDWDDIPSQLQQGMCTSSWEISVEWYTPEHICEQQDRANIALHHLADVLEDSIS